MNAIPLKPRINDASDRITEARALVEVIFMAAAGIGDRDQTHAIQVVCEHADSRLEQVLEDLEEIGGSL